MHRISQYIYDVCKSHIEFHNVKLLTLSSWERNQEMWHPHVLSYKFGFATFVLGQSYDIEVRIILENYVDINPYLYRAMYELEQKYGIKTGVTQEEMIKSVGLDDPFKVFLDKTN